MFDNRWENWSSEFDETVAARAFDPAVREFLLDILARFGDEVRARDPDFPDEVRPGTFSVVLNERMSRLDLPPTVRLMVPEVIAVFLEHLQETGRLGEGRDWAAQIRILGNSFRERIRPEGGVKGETFRRPAGTSAVGRNDPCPCGSGKKFKKCCATR